MKILMAMNSALLTMELHMNFRWIPSHVILLCCCSTLVSALPPRACVAPHNEYPFCNVSLTRSQRVQDLISRLTLDEKPYLLQARESPKGNISRLGIPEYDWGTNCMHGVQSRCSPDGRCPTLFPNPNTLGSSWNQTLWRAMGQVIGLELRALWLQNVGENHKSNLPHLGLDCWSPNIGVVRDPRWGRNMETPSEDPYVLGVYGTQYTLGLQNYSEAPNYLMAVATLKHFVANSLEGPSWGINGTWGDGHISRHTDNAKISLYDLHSTYLRAFRTAVVDGNAAGIMCSYNRVNGVPMCANEVLLKQVLRGEWGFQGYVTSDSGALDDFHHNYAKDYNETVALALQAGCDVESATWPDGHPWETGGNYIDYVPNLVRAGLLQEALLDKAVWNALDIRFRLGLFDPIENQPLWHVEPAIVQAPDNVKLAKEATAQGFVLLKNDNKVLPLDPSKKIGLIGPHINDRHTMLGNYLSEICKDDPKNSCVTSFKEGFEAAAAEHGGTILSATGCAVVGNVSTSDFEKAIEIARNVDVVVFIGGLNLTLENEAMDRPNISLPLVQQVLLEALADENPNLVLVALHGGMVGVDSIIDSVGAFVSAGYPGRYAGDVLPQALFGQLEESVWGKSSITWYHDQVIHEELNVLDFEMARPPGRTYRYYTGKPLFPFGFGLNPLTSFELAGLAASCFAGEDCSKILLSVQVANVGSAPADEVVMAYFLPPEDLPTFEPASSLKKELFGFERVHVLPGTSVTVSFEVTTKSLELYDEYGKKKSFPGTYTLQLSNGVQTVEPEVILLQDGRFQLPTQELATQ